MSTQHFDEVAATWDQETRRLAVAQDVAETILDAIPLDRHSRVLDFGCGTGLLALALAPHVGTLAGADPSAGMRQVLTDKAAALGLNLDIRPLAADGAGDLGGPYDAIVSSMALHHVADVPALLARFREYLAPGGWVALADLDHEDGSFHDHPEGVYHHGFRRGLMERWLQDAGYREILIQTAASFPKGDRTYSLFLATGQR